MKLSIFPPDKIPVYHSDQVAGKSIRYLADREMGGIQSFAMGLSTLAPGVRGGTGSHDCEEVFYFLYGTATVVIDGNMVPVEAGTVVIVPPNVSHKVENNSTDKCEYLWIASPQPERMDGLQVISAQENW